MDDTFEVDLQRWPLLGWQEVELRGYDQPVRAVSDRVIERIIEGIQSGAEFKPVFVRENYELAFGEYELQSYSLDFVLDDSLPSWKRIYQGGHNRAVAHYIEGRPLLCRRKPKDIRPIIFKEGARPEFYPISETLILDDSEFVGNEGHNVGLESREEKWAMERAAK